MWTDDLLDEWERVIVRRERRSAEAAAAITAAIREFFADTRIPTETYRSLIAEVEGPDPDDNVHMAAAVAGQVETLVTWDDGELRLRLHEEPCGHGREPGRLSLFPL
jgi:predicted nucleic acid-binding protein